MLNVFGQTRRDGGARRMARCCGFGAWEISRAAWAGTLRRAPRPMVLGEGGLAPRTGGRLGVFPGIVSRHSLANVIQTYDLCPSERAEMPT